MEDAATMTFPPSVRRASGVAFCGLPKLRSVTAGARVDCLESAFGESGVRSVRLLPGTRKISARTFEGCAGLRSVILPEGLEEVGERAFFWSGI